MKHRFICKQRKWGFKIAEKLALRCRIVHPLYLQRCESASHLTNVFESQNTDAAAGTLALNTGCQVSLPDWAFKAAICKFQDIFTTDSLSGHMSPRQKKKKRKEEKKLLATALSFFTKWMKKMNGCILCQTSVFTLTRQHVRLKKKKKKDQATHKMPDWLWLAR